MVKFRKFVKQWRLIGRAETEEESGITESSFSYMYISQGQIVTQGRWQ